MKFFPWYCGNCQEESVYSTTITYKIDWVEPDLIMPNLVIPQCIKCAELHFTDDVDEQIRAFIKKERSIL